MVRVAPVVMLMAILFLVGCMTTGMDVSEYTRARFVLESTSDEDFSAIVKLPLSEVQIPVEGDAILSEFDYHAIDVAEVSLGKCLMFTLKPTAARAFYQLSVMNQGKRLVLVVDGVGLGARRIDAPIADGRIFMFLEATDEKLQEIAEKLQRTNIDIQKKLSR